MIKTVKVKKKFRLDELIKYVRDNGINSQAFVSDAGRASVYFDSEQNLSLGEYTYGELNIERTFTVEVEEKINNKTIFKSVVGVLDNDEIMLTNMHTTIKDIQDKYGPMKEIHAVIDGKLEQIWEAESDVK